ncbi:helix-turn-helix domain-containing protein [Sulfobacillus harzensis]|uniref:Helix-turn-helix transcriptional regulator n=1 Tax=Sulfobacillus harzensis TaxID=2729629 RepID=A0A7Y0Q4N5_9FIRM|nr:helix-turn-helix transcriptional regulator [Sulfobacillus harzensis]
MGVRGATVFTYEKGTVRPSVITLYRLAKVLDCSPTLLLEDFVSPNEED